ncbi:MAG: hypothetical protein AMXMBFR34_21090 [Myxococcaceae bacterium]
MREEVPSGARVLIVDDDPMIRRLFVRALTRLGLAHVVVATDEEARGAVTREAFAMVLIDEHLGHAKGSELVRDLRRLALGKPQWVCISGSVLAGDPPPDGFDGAEEKPTTFDAMGALVERWATPRRNS